MDFSFEGLGTFQNETALTTEILFSHIFFSRIRFNIKTDLLNLCLVYPYVGESERLRAISCINSYTQPTTFHLTSKKKNQPNPTNVYKTAFANYFRLNKIHFRSRKHTHTLCCFCFFIQTFFSIKRCRGFYRKKKKKINPKLVLLHQKETHAPVSKAFVPLATERFSWPPVARSDAPSFPRPHQVPRGSGRRWAPRA